ncbi:MAG: 2-oxoglutarate dehydrogenase E1 component [Bacteroidetes bacterium]|nr:MAG: 2-oxoglutarate dehydrogenase E1 component [Bacteroidota bacterium]
MSDQLSFLSNGDPAYFEQVYKTYQADPASVPAEWKRFFDGFEFALAHYGEGESVKNETSRALSPVSENTASKEIAVLNLINDYRMRGHLFAATNPVRKRREHKPPLQKERLGLTDADLDTVFQAGTDVGIGPARLRDIIALLEETYIRSIAVEYKYVRTPEMVMWLQERMERSRNHPSFSIERKKRILGKLNEAVIFERFLGKKFVGQKRFSLEGAETLIPALDAVIEKGAELGIREFSMGMAHRGRLNVLANILHKEYDEIFSEFEGKEYENSIFQGDVKYHLGFSSDVDTTAGHRVHLSLLPNPSHLEAVDPVVEGVARAKIDRKYGGDFNKVAPILIHGDAAVAAQGIVYEVIQMSLIEGYKTGGTIHLVINNQVGFTTNFIDARSSTYCTDIAKVTQSPVFHVNGDDVEALVYATEMAMEFRQTFNRDVFIDILCYRRHGHNEADEPSFTQPLLYEKIKQHPDPREIYLKKLLSSAEIEADMAKALEKEFNQKLQSELEESMARQKLAFAPYLKGTWEGIRRVTNEDFDVLSPETGKERELLTDIARKIHQIPEDFKAHPKIVKLFEERLKMVQEDKLDWALGELLAYGTLLLEGINIRLSGQDVRRGTFSHRHAVIVSTDDERNYFPLNHISEKQGDFVAYNSLLSEYGVLGFEYGYSTANPNNMVIWEAQFGDFANGSQIVMDQYISAAETKWQRMSGLIQYLPHGYEGQGPEHSSARIERYLELCARKNMQVLNCTTPANFFHALRRQFTWDFRIPMVFFTPKKLLRFPACVSSLDDFGPGTRFQEIIDDRWVNPADVKKVLVCSGKIYYDLLKHQQDNQRRDVAVLRLEQLYPLPQVQIRELIGKYENASWVWVQEEPRNMGPWSYIHRVVTEAPITCVARKPSPSPAAGSHKSHHAEEQLLIEEAFYPVEEMEKTVVK